MEHLFSQNWAYMHFAMVLAISCAQLTVLYSMSNGATSPQGLGMYGVYFTASLLGWVALIMQRGPMTFVTLDVPAIATIISGYVLFLATSTRAEVSVGKLAFGALCLAAVLAAFFTTGPQMFYILAVVGAMFYGATTLMAAMRGWRQRNMGDALIAAGSVVMTIGLVVALILYGNNGNLVDAKSLATGVYGAAYAIIAIGFIAAVYGDSQRHLSHMTTEDPLTRLTNRRGLEDVLKVTLATAARNRLPTSVILINLNHFQQIIDSFGQETGDHLLQQIAQLLKRDCRGSDVVSKINSDEFMLVLPETPPESARILADRLLTSISGDTLLVDGHNIDVSIILGIAGAVGEINLDQLHREAGRAIQLARKGGGKVASAQASTIRLSNEGVV
jgi:diguanylate cyclase (GGDEF)-like protein